MNQKQRRENIDDQLEEYHEIWSIYDPDNTGKVDTKVLGKVLRSFGQNPSEQEINDIRREIDPEKSGFFDFSSLLAAIARHLAKKDTMEELIEAMKAFDRDGDGFIPEQEMRYLLMNFGEPLSAVEVNDLINRADPDKDGYVNYSQFIKYLMNAK